MYYCKWHIYFWLVIAILVALASCNRVPSEKPNFYFDAEQYIKSEIDTLSHSSTHYNNTIVFNGASESRMDIPSDSSIYKEMFALFKQTNINSGVLKGAYEIDTFWILDPITQENIEVHNYATSNQKLKVKWLQVYSNGSLKASISQNNFLFSYDKEIYYEKDKKFSVISWQRTMGQDTLNIFNSIEFL